MYIPYMYFTLTDKCPFHSYSTAGVKYSNKRANCPLFFFSISAFSGSSDNENARSSKYR